MNVLVIVASGLQLGYVGCYGNDWIAMPTLDRLAAEGVVFDQYFADQPDPASARLAWRSGRLQFPVAAKEASATEDLLPLLHGQHVHTSLLVDARQLLYPTFAEGWQEVGKMSATTADKLLAAVATILDRLTGRDPWLLWIDLALLLPPWLVPEDCCQRYFAESADESEEEPLTPWTEPLPQTLAAGDDITFLRLQSTYAGAVTYLDRMLGQIREALEKRRLFDDLLLIVTTDRGWPLGEHGHVGTHEPLLHEELLHLPLILRLPRGEEAARRVGALTQPVDLMPTLLEAFGVPLPVVHGQSLWPLVRGKETEAREYVVSGLQKGTDAEWALRTPEWFFRLPASGERPQLFVKPDDRWEINDVVQHHLPWSEHLEQTLRAFVDASHQPGPLQAPALGDIEDEAEPGREETS